MNQKKVAGVVAGVALTLGAAAAPALADAKGEAAAIGSPGVLSGNVLNAPIHIPVNLCNNTVNVIAIMNPTFGAPCVNA
ncbi:chaplin [Streptomyces sp. NRRL F-2664]|uniref:chaplin n=1 Tax=Streptomyces sp. NRRL F-2664 TaxID=1463842 RepID=UPI0004C5C85E|nr:chaplin [Streptomyces sp. NRRL F-2664]